ncbi:MAG: hypothetical protein ACI8PP_001757, partial [Candidatus Pseudothioglobus sp.]
FADKIRAIFVSPAFYSRLWCLLKGVFCGFSCAVFWADG